MENESKDSENNSNNKESGERISMEPIITGSMYQKLLKDVFVFVFNGANKGNILTHGAILKTFP